jgi:hypothetical protein
MVRHNFRLGKRFFSYQVLERHLRSLILNCFGHSSNTG